ncbi:Ger(x)C family spore germination protein [Paenibacillus sp. alder61]|uniref:Ger(X)C family spore germination protein n=1 Tax=Paenibacillus faecis TaxID=862114 RepID=A0A5D0CUT6_9BACL|nr:MULTISPECIES: Ger(x)C family spore germination protein [Paenibacillus]MCA1291829.1 Ger(x)C family spore germination protein [Paenibacillus sp. alder61]TYA13430.1 Ger(x)C family spore germination protein [Paenibacillus faecis]
MIHNRYKNIRLAFTTGLAIVILIVTGGCWSSKEINSRAFALTMLIDRTENGEFELTIGFPLPNRMIPGQAGGSGQAKGEPFSFITKRASNIGEALREIQVDMSRTISFGQTRIIIVGRRLAEQGLDPVLEFVNRQPAFHLSANLFVTPQSLRDISYTPLIFERFVSDILRKYINQHVTLDTTVKDFIMAGYQGGDILLPLLSFSKQPEVEAQTSEKERWMGTGGAAIFSKGKMSNVELNPQELRGALWISSQLTSSIVTVNSPSGGEDISCVAQNIGTKLKPVIRGGKVAFQVLSQASAYVLSSNASVDLKDPDKLEKIEDLMEQDIKARLEKVLAKTRKARSDAFLMSQYLDWRYPKVWRKIEPEWREYYAAELPIEVKIKIKLDRTGGITRSVTQNNYK